MTQLQDSRGLSLNDGDLVIECRSLRYGVVLDGKTYFHTQLCDTPDVELHNTNVIKLHDLTAAEEQVRDELLFAVIENKATSHDGVVTQDAINAAIAILKNELKYPLLDICELQQYEKRCFIMTAEQFESICKKMYGDSSCINIDSNVGILISGVTKKLKHNNDVVKDLSPQGIMAESIHVYGRGRETKVYIILKK